MIHKFILSIPHIPRPAAAGEKLAEQRNLKIVLLQIRFNTRRPLWVTRQMQQIFQFYANRHNKQWPNAAQLAGS